MANMQTPRDAESESLREAIAAVSQLSGFGDITLAGGGTRMSEAWFLGPRAENADEFERLIVEAIRDQAFWRRNFHPSDPAHITEEIKRSPEFLQASDS